MNEAQSTKRLLENEVLDDVKSEKNIIDQRTKGYVEKLFLLN